MSDEELISFLGIPITRRQWWLFFWIFLSFSIVGVSLVIALIRPEGHQWVWVSRSAWISNVGIVVETLRSLSEAAKRKLLGWIGMYLFVLFCGYLLLLFLLEVDKAVPQLRDIKGPANFPGTPRVPRFMR